MYKYKVFEKVWIMKGNKPIELWVVEIHIIIKKSPYYPKQSDILHSVCNYKLSDDNIYPQNNIFKSKDDLLSSL